MDMFDFAGLLFGGNRNRPEATTVTASGAASSEDGVASITLDADVTPAEDVGEDADQTVIDLPTSPDVDEGDELIVTLVGDGPLKTPVVTANPGSGDRMRALANSAKTIANAAQAVADAINQHFWHDDNGAHVTEATQEEWEQNHSGPNSLWNSLGMLFRDGLTNLLTLTTESGARALTIWDGLGNAAGNVVASFSGTEVSLGANSTSSTIDMCGGAFKFDVDTSDPNNEAATIWLDQDAVDPSTASAPVLRILSGTSSVGRGIVIRGTAAAQWPISIVNYNGSTTTEHVGLGSLGVLTPNIKFSSSGMGTIDAYNGILVTTSIGSNSWSTPAGTVLWSSGGWHMVANQTANLAYNVSTCPTGIVLHWQPYTSSTTQNYNHTYYFVPKTHVASYNGTGVVVQLGNHDFSNMASKYLYISNDHITGHANNTATGTGSGITYANNKWVLTQIIAV